MVRLMPLQGTQENLLSVPLPSRPGEDTRKQPSASQEEAFTRTPPFWHPDFRLLASEIIKGKFVV